jgi:glycosyltransferase involved in cell wall biosynthesis
MNPEVTCLQLSYGRPQLSVEAVESFLRQTYQNKKLIIVNTHPSPVYFDKEYSSIKVFNIKPLERLSDIYRFGIQQIKSPYFCIFDDDDIYLPWHIADRVAERLKSDDFDAIGHEVCFSSSGNVIDNLGGNMFVAQYLYDNNGILPDAGLACWDGNWHSKPWKRKHLISPYLPSYIYRWGTGENHISGLAGEEGQHKVYLSNIEQKHRLRFDFPWKPAWGRNYEQDVIDYLEGD